MIIDLQNKCYRLGNGAFGSVYQGKDELGNNYAVKINESSEWEEENVKALINEDFFLRYLHKGSQEENPHLVKRIAWTFINSEGPALILQEEGQNLYRYLLDHYPVTHPLS